MSRPPRDPDSSNADRFDAVVVGAGFAGLYMLHRLRTMGLRVRVFEAGAGVGGTWYWNRYPGARCDVESLEYSYQFDEALQQEWEWTERYASQPEILRYLEHVTDRFDLRRDIQFDTRIVSATYDEPSHRWRLATDTARQVVARHCIFATGCLSCPTTPELPGRDRFRGSVHHTGRWPHEPVHFDSRRVGVIGTGSSAVQSIPLIAEEAAHLTVFQRTATYSVPANNRPLDPELVRELKSEYRAFRERNRQMIFGLGSQLPPSGRSARDVDTAERQRIFEERWQHGGLPFLGAFSDLLLDREANAMAADFVRHKITEEVTDDAVAERLVPDTVLGCKRLCVDTGYYATFNRPNVTLVDLRREPIQELTAGGVRTSAAEYPLDALVLATGFDAMTGALLGIDIRGRESLTLAEKWADGPRAYLGLATAGFPNMFMITGPGSPSVLTNMVPSIEQHVEWIADCIAWQRANDVVAFEPSRVAEDAWVDHVNEVAGLTLFIACDSWYRGANVPGKPRVFMPYLGFPQYVRRCDEVAARGYEGFELTPA